MRPKARTTALPRRVRFYHAKIDSDSLESGKNYHALKNVVIILITPYDPFGLNRMVYTIQNGCLEEPQMPYDDGARTLFLYTRGTVGNPREELRQLLTYMEHTTRANAANENLKQIQSMVETVKHDKGVSVGYMKVYEREEMLLNRGIQQGMKQGIEQGMKQGIEAFILDNLEEQVPEDRILEKLQRRFHIPEDEAREFFDKYACAEK